MILAIRDRDNAALVLGYVDVPLRDARPGSRIEFHLKPATEPLPDGWSEVMLPPGGITRLELDVEHVVVPVDEGRDIEYVTALNSKGLPVAVLRRIPGFTEQRSIEGV